MNDHCGLISGTREELARDARCTVVEVSSAIDEINHTGTADVTERNGVVTVVNRRMKREFDARKKASERVKRHRSKQPVTPPNRDGNRDILYTRGYIPETIGREGSAHAPPEAVVPTVKEVTDFCSVGVGIPADYCQHYHEENTIRNRWIRGGQLIQWRIDIVKWWAKDRATWSQKPNQKQNAASSLPKPKVKDA